MGESFQDYSWIQDFEADFPKKVSLIMLNRKNYDRVFLFIYSLSEDNWPINLEIVNI